MNKEEKPKSEKAFLGAQVALVATLVCGGIFTANLLIEGMKLFCGKDTDRWNS